MGPQNTGDKTVWSDRLTIVGSRVSGTAKRTGEPHRKGAAHVEGTTFVGLDVHKEAINVASSCRGRLVRWSGRRATTWRRFAAW